MRGREDAERLGKVTITVDSGASKTVIPKDFCRSVPVLPSVGSKEGVEYEVAPGEKIANEGERTLQIMTEECLPITMKMQVCGVSKALLSVSKLCKAGHKVVFDDDWSYIEHKQTGQRTSIMPEGGVYTLDVWVRTGKAASFQGQAN